MGNQVTESKLWEGLLGKARAASYQTVTPVLKIHELAHWNQTISGSLLSDVGHVEIALRNSLDLKLEEIHLAKGIENSWIFDDGGHLEKLGGQGHSNYLSTAKFRVAKTRTQVTRDDVVAELTLGFWLSLLGRRYRAIHPDLISAFRGAESRNMGPITELSNRFRVVRNRVAHHHRILHRDLNADLSSILEFASLIEPALAEFLVGNSRTTYLIREFSQQMGSAGPSKANEPIS